MDALSPILELSLIRIGSCINLRKSGGGTPPAPHKPNNHGFKAADDEHNNNGDNNDNAANTYSYRNTSTVADSERGDALPNVV